MALLTQITARPAWRCDHETPVLAPLMVIRMFGGPENPNSSMMSLWPNLSLSGPLNLELAGTSSLKLLCCVQAETYARIGIKKCLRRPGLAVQPVCKSDSHQIKRPH